MNALGAGSLVHGDLIVIIAARGLNAVATLYRYKIERAVRRSVAELGIMLEYDELAHSHFASCRRVVVFKHIDDGIPQELEVILGEVRDAAREICRNKAVGTVKSV